MKSAFKISDALGALISVSWFILYAGGGAFLLAKQATANPENVSPYVPLVIFSWIIGFFVGHRLIEHLFSSIVELTKPSESFVGTDSVRVPEITVNIDCIPSIYSNKITTNFLRNDTICSGYNAKTNYNKKETGKIVSLFKTSAKIYKVPVGC